MHMFDVECVSKDKELIRQFALDVWNYFDYVLKNSDKISFNLDDRIIGVEQYLRLVDEETVGYPTVRTLIPGNTEDIHKYKITIEPYD